MVFLRLLIGALIGVRTAARRIQVAVNDVAFSLDATSEDQLHDFCVLQGMRVADCRRMRREWAGRQERATHQQETTSAAVTIYVVPMSAKVHNFAPVFEPGSDGGYTLANPGAPDWLLSLLSMLPAVAVPEDTLSSNISVHVVAPWRSAPEAAATAQAWRPPVPPDHGGQNTRVVVLLLVSLHQFGQPGIEAIRARLLVAEHDRLKALLSGTGGRVAAVVADDEFFAFPLELYARMDLVFRLGDFDPRVCGTAAAAAAAVSASTEACGRVHWIPRGPSAKFMGHLDAIVRNTSGGPPLPLQPASARRYLANFIGNVNSAICIGEMLVDHGNPHLSVFKPPRPLRSCYRPPARPAALSGLRKMQTRREEDGRPLLLRPSSGFALNPKHGLNLSEASSAGLRPAAYARALVDSVFTVCAPSSSAESTRIYEALEAGSIPIVWWPGVSAGLPFGGGAACPLPNLGRRTRGGAAVEWEKRLPALLRSWEARSPAELDHLQRKVQEWWAGFKRETGSRVGRALSALLRADVEPIVVPAEEADDGEGEGEERVFFGSVELLPDGIRSRYRALHAHFARLKIEKGDAEDHQRATVSVVAQGYQLGWAVVEGRQVIQDLCEEAERQALGNRHSLHVDMGVVSALSVKRPLFCLYEAMRLSVKLRLWVQFDCIGAALGWFDPYSASLATMKAEGYWIRENWAAYNLQQEETEMLVRAANISKRTGRPPLLPDSVAEVWGGGLRAQLVFSSLRLCLARGHNASRAVYGDVADGPNVRALRAVFDAHMQEVFKPIL